MKSANDIIKDIKNKFYSPIYFLYGEESYYINKIAEYIEDNVIEESEKQFNLTILYGKDVKSELILTQVKSIPMMSDYQLVILKNAQDLSDKDFEKLYPYFEKPSQSTIFVICYHGDTKKNKNKLEKLEKNVVVFYSEKKKDFQISKWIVEYLAKRKFNCSETTAQIIADFLGNDLEKIDNELSKLMINLTPGQTITMDDVEQNIGISKKYNVFELVKAIASRNKIKAISIALSFASNPKENSIFIVISSLFSFFQKVYLCHQAQDKNEVSLTRTLGCNIYQVRDCVAASRVYSIQAVLKVFKLLREYDLKIKGVNNVTPESELIKELVYKIVTIV